MTLESIVIHDPILNVMLETMTILLRKILFIRAVI